MTKDLSGVYNEWKFVRSNTISFIKDLGEDGINTKLNRPELDTFKKHFLEMIDVQEAYSLAIRTGKMSFEYVRNNDDFKEDISNVELLKNVATVDKKMKSRLEKSSYDIQIEWEEGPRTLQSHISALISHEMFHIGQLVGFCYAQNIKIPDYIAMMWGLSNQNIK